MERFSRHARVSGCKAGHDQRPRRKKLLNDATNIIALDPMFWADTDEALVVLRLLAAYQDALQSRDCTLLDLYFLFNGSEETKSTGTSPPLREQVLKAADEATSRSQGRLSVKSERGGNPRSLKTLFDKYFNLHKKSLCPSGLGVLSLCLTPQCLMKGVPHPASGGIAEMFDKQAGRLTPGPVEGNQVSNELQDYLVKLEDAARKIKKKTPFPPVEQPRDADNESEYQLRDRLGRTYLRPEVLEEWEGDPIGWWRERGSRCWPHPPLWQGPCCRAK